MTPCRVRSSPEPTPARRLILWLVLGLGPGPCLLTPSVTAAAARPRPGGELHFQLPAPPGDFDPACVHPLGDLALARALHATLYTPGRTGLAPGLAEALPTVSADGLEWRLRLRAGLRFQDGAPVTALEVAESLSRLLRPHSGSAHGWIAAAIEGAEAVMNGSARSLAGVQPLSERELRIVISFPLPDLVPALASAPAALVHASPAGLSGAGPFRLAARSPEALRLDPFPSPYHIAEEIIANFINKKKFS